MTIETTFPMCDICIVGKNRCAKLCKDAEQWEAFKKGGPIPDFLLEAVKEP